MQKLTRSLFLNLVLLSSLLFSTVGNSSIPAGSFQECSDLLISNFISADLLESAIREGRAKVPEFRAIQQIAKELNVRVWLFGGSAASYLHYVRWDLLKQKHNHQNHAVFFDYDFTSIFRSTQDIDLVIDGDPELTKKFYDIITKRYPHFLGKKESWEVRSLNHRIGEPGDFSFKEALLLDHDFHNQNSDSNSVGMIELTESSEPIIRDLRNWNKSDNVFLADSIANRISYLKNEKHHYTVRASRGENPEILSVIRYLVKAFQYDLMIPEDQKVMIQNIIADFDPLLIKNSTASRRITQTAKKMILNSMNVERSINVLDSLGLRQKLLLLNPSTDPNHHTIWLSKEPLRTKPVGDGNGITASELGIQVVAHETSNFLSYESITRSSTLGPNVFISRKGTLSESAAYGDGFYTRLGNQGARGTGFTIRFKVKPEAKLGTDFIKHDDYIIFLNKNALEIIPEALSLNLLDLIEMVENNNLPQFHKSDQALFEKLKRRMSARVLTESLLSKLPLDDDRSFELLNRFLVALNEPEARKLISDESLQHLLRNIYEQAVPLMASENSTNKIKFISLFSASVDLFDEFNIFNKSDFTNYLQQTFEDDRQGFEVRKYAFYELILFVKDHQLLSPLAVSLTEAQIETMAQELNQWSSCQDFRKKRFIKTVNELLYDILAKDNLNLFKILVQFKLISLSRVNENGYSLLLTADYYEANKIIEWLVSNPNYDLNRKNRFQNSDIEQLILLGKSSLVDFIKSKRSGLIYRNLSVKERNDDGSPIIDFIKIQPGVTRVVPATELTKPEELVNIDKSFEIFSVKTTFSIWKRVLSLLLRFTPSEEYEYLKSSSERYAGQPDYPFYGSAKIIRIWIEGLNTLSKHQSPLVQEELKNIFPGHYFGAIYRLPKDAEWMLMARNGGLAEGANFFSNKDEAFSQYAWVSQTPYLSHSPSIAVGKLKPMLYNGQPIYDVQGNVSDLIFETYDEMRVVLSQVSFLRGGFGLANLKKTDLNARWSNSGSLGANTGFRLVREIL